MKQMKKLMMSAILAAGMLSGCGSSTGEEMPKVSVAQIMAHKSLDTIRDSFDAEMKELGYVDGENIDLDYQDAGGNTSTLEGAARYAADIPVIFSAVSDPITAGLTSTLEEPDKNMTGTMDDVQVEQILQRALEVDPDMERLGVVYNASETNSVTNIAKAKQFCE